MSVVTCSAVTFLVNLRAFLSRVTPKLLSDKKTDVAEAKLGGEEVTGLVLLSGELRGKDEAGLFTLFLLFLLETTTACKSFQGSQI